MNGQSDNATVPSRTTVRIPTASGDELEAWLYLPEGEGPHPAVVMAHGIGAIKAGRDHGELAGYVDDEPPMWPPIGELLTIAPPPDRSIAGISCFIESNTPRMLMSQT